MYFNLPLPKNQHYLDRYIKLIQWAQTQTFEGYTERHHILPKALGGLNNKENLIILSARAHFLVHYCLYKAYGGKMTYAFNIMFVNSAPHINRYTKITSKQYENFKVIRSKQMKERIPWNKGKKGILIAWNKGKKMLTEQKRKNYVVTELTKQKISKALTGRKQSEKTKQKRSNTLREIDHKPPTWNKGLKTGPQTEEHVRKRSQAMMGKKLGPFTPKHIENISKSLQGNNNPNYGKKTWINTITLQIYYSFDCPGSEWIRGRKISSIKEVLSSINTT